MSYQCISAAEAKAMMSERNALMVDIRDPASFNAGHIEDAFHITDNNVDEFIAHADLQRPVIVCCFHGNMSKGAAAYFSENGFAETYSLDGGYAGWPKA